MKRLLIYTATMPPLMLYKGLAFSVLWKWFAVPLGLPPLSVAHAFGLLVLVSFATHQARSPDESSGDQSSFLIAVGIVIPTMALAFGWVAKELM